MITQGGLTWFHGHGLADVGANTPITEDTVFRVASLTKTFTGVGVMQLWEQGVVDLDAPGKRLPSYLPACPGETEPVARHNPAPPHPYRGSWILAAAVGPAPARRRLGDRARSSGALPLVQYYRRGLPVEVEPGTKWAYSNHGFAALGQIVEDVSGQPMGRLAENGTQRTRLGVEAGNRGDHVPTTLPARSTCPGHGFGVRTRRGRGSTHCWHDRHPGGLPFGHGPGSGGGIGVIVLSNTGDLDGRGATVPLATMLLRLLLGLSVDPIRNDIPPRPENWSGICGWYGPAPGPVTNLFSRALMGGPEVVVQDGHLMLKTLSPIPSMRRGFRLYPDDPDDPRVFRIYFPEFGMNFRVVFDGPTYRSATRLLMDVMSFEKRPDSRNPRPWATGGLAVHCGAGHPRRSASSPCQRTRSVFAVKLKAPPPAPCGALRARPVCRVTEPVLEDSKSR